MSWEKTSVVGLFSTKTQKYRFLVIGFTIMLAIVFLFSLEALIKPARAELGPARIAQKHKFENINFNPPFITETAKLIASDGESADSFGRESIDVDGNTLIIGADLDDIGTNTNQGSAYIFEQDQNDPGSWDQVVKLIAFDGATFYHYGHAVSVYGDIAVVGSDRADDNGSNSGSVYVYERNQGGVDNWGFVTKIIPLDNETEDRFGFSVALSGETLVVGAINDDDNGENVGAAYIFQKNKGGPNNWGLVKKILPAEGAEGDVFGISLSIDGDSLAAGAFRDDDNGDDSGSAYVYQKNQGGLDNWGQVDKVLAQDGEADDFFGVDVDLASNILVVGASRDDDNGDDSGSAYVFERNTRGNTWTQIAKLTTSDGGIRDYFGRAVAVGEDFVVVGAHNADIGLNVNQGAGYLYHRNEGGINNWGNVAKFTSSDGESNDAFGTSTAIYNDLIFIGSDSSGNEIVSGAVYVYQWLPDLQISKTAEQSPVYAEDIFTYTLTITNAGLQIIDTVLVTDTLPAEVSLIDDTCGVGTIPWIWNVGTMSHGSTSCLITVSVVSTNTAVITNTAVVGGNIIEQQTENNTASASILNNGSRPPKIFLPIIEYSDCDVLFFDDFSNSNSGWPVGDDGNILYAYTGGKYRVLVRDEFWWAGARPILYFSDYRVSVDAKNITDADGAFGLFFGMNDDFSQFYAFMIDSVNGKYWLLKISGSNWTTLVNGDSAAIKGGTQDNRLTIVRDGNDIKAYVNDVLLASIANSAYTGDRTVGVIVNSFEDPLDIRFDDFLVESIGCVAGTRTSAAPQEISHSAVAPEFDVFDGPRKK